MDAPSDGRKRSLDAITEEVAKAKRHRGVPSGHLIVGTHVSPCFRALTRARDCCTAPTDELVDFTSTVTPHGRPAGWELVIYTSAKAAKAAAKAAEAEAATVAKAPKAEAEAAEKAAARQAKELEPRRVRMLMCHGPWCRSIGRHLVVGMSHVTRVARPPGVRCGPVARRDTGGRGQKREGHPRAGARTCCVRASAASLRVVSRGVCIIQ